MPLWVTEESITALRARMMHFIDEQRDPIAHLAVEELGVLQGLHNEYPQRADQLARQLRDHATTRAGWSIYQARAISFATFAEQARPLRAEIRRAAAGNVVNINRTPRRNSTEPLESLVPADMVMMPSLRLRGIGHLRLKREGRIWFDDFYKRIKVDWNGSNDGATIAERNIDDEFYGNVAVWFAQQDQERLGNITIRQVIEWVSTMARLDKRNSPRDWLNGLVWDNEPRLYRVLTRGFGAPETEFNGAAGRCWFVGMVARIFRPGCQLDNVLVLHGAQGIGKSQALRLLGGDWYKAATSDIYSKDFLQEIFGAMIFEIPELHSIVTSNASASKAKARITNQSDDFRLPYGYTVERFYRTAFFIGTTNNRDWHHDDSGARRFWPVHCGVIDLDWIREYRDQLFAEAVAYFNLGTDDVQGQWWNVPEDEQRELMEHETGENIWQAAIERRLSEPDLYRGRPGEAITRWEGVLSETANWGNAVTTARIAYQWLRLNASEAAKRSASNAIGSIMRHAGWQRVRFRMPGSNSLAWGWLPTPQAAPAAEAPVDPEEDEPF